jgi:hypothetical protein
MFFAIEWGGGGAGEIKSADLLSVQLCSLTLLCAEKPLSQYDPPSQIQEWLKSPFQ